MRELVGQWLSFYELRSLRERIIIVVTLMALTWGVWISSLGGYVLDGRVAVVSDIERLAEDLKVQSAERSRLQQIDQVGAQDALRNRREQTSQRLAQQRKALDELLARFIAPQQVPVLLEDMLRQHRDLKLVRLTSQPTEPLLITNDQGEAVSSGIFRHPVQIELTGGYLDLVSYLQQLERSHWRLTYRKLSYSVEQYPTAKVVLELETLSRSEEWIGV